jgi:hypothetical protein
MHSPAISAPRRLWHVDKFIKVSRQLRQRNEAFPHFTNLGHDSCQSPLRGTHVDELAGSPAVALAQGR